MASTVDVELAEAVAAFYDDPLGFVLFAFPWGEPGGPLADHDGPDEWQREFLAGIGAEVRANAFNGKDPVAPIRRCVSSGHGIGKSVMVAWLVLWVMSTRPHCKGTVTANTYTQLQTKTWAAIRTWAARCITAHWFDVTSERISYKGHRDSWFFALQSSKEENSEAFAGQHAADSSSVYIFDEDSAIPSKIHEVSEGGLTDGEPMVFRFGNPTRTEGDFYRDCFGSGRHRWHPTIIDSRSSRFTNKRQIEEWRQDHGEDSDFFRVRVRGLPPSAGDLQFIPLDLVSAAQQRQVSPAADEPLVMGVDMARGGADECVIRYRRGHDARSIKPVRVPGEKARDTMHMATLVSDLLGRSYDGRKVAVCFVDATGGSIGGPLADRLRQLGHQRVIDVQFGGESPDARYGNMRAFMWGRLRDWLRHGAIDALADLETDLTGPSYFHDKRDRLVLESKEDMKKRGLDSPDDGDALALTFAQVVAPTAAAPVEPYRPRSPWG